MGLEVHEIVNDAKPVEVRLGIVETSPNVFRVAYDGRVKGDSRGYTRSQAIEAARQIAVQADGRWEGSQWVPIIYKMDMPGETQ